uniref:WRC domain-containing protein n=1 Tax=Davidia involucrata TaxID=16924 RepID=A0A5B7BI79_DAVIN
MRIRKHAKISAMLSHTSGSSSHLSSTETLLQTHVCQLNRSPWDVIIFPPDSSSTPPYQVDGDDSFTGNGSLGDSIGAVESVASMKISLEEEKRENGEEENNQLGFDNGEEAILCCKSDGKGWQCRREAKEGHSLCDHHLAQLRNYNSLGHLSSKKSEKLPEKAAATICRRPRLPLKKASSGSNPHEFYYYSGFGPLWGKKRGNTKPPKVEPALIEIATPPSSPELDYVEDDEEEEGDAGKKRSRKPIKARSLKSLM